MEKRCDKQSDLRQSDIFIVKKNKGESARQKREVKGRSNAREE